MPSPSPETRKLLDAICALPLGDTALMEVCGTHTMAIARSGLKSLLPSHIHLLSGPGCPVCVTPAQEIDAILSLSLRPGVIIASYGDMLRVPGSVRGDSLSRRRALGARVEVVYSPMDAVELAGKNPDQQVVFLGVGFETSAPGTAAAILSAAEEKLPNFSVYPLLKLVEPALRALSAEADFAVQGFLCPGHVASIIGEDGFAYLTEELSIPAVIAGFEPTEILQAIYRLLRQIAEGKPRLENAYPRAVTSHGNTLARKIIEECFVPAPALWRGLGLIPHSGLILRDNLADYDARLRFGISPASLMQDSPSGCRCGQVIRGRLSPRDCPLFGKLCSPEDPVGPCMVSSEGACAAAYKYQVI